MANWFGNLELGIKFGIVLGGLIVIVMIAGFIKLFVVKRRIRKFAKEAKDPEKENGELNSLTKREEDEGDLFGVRALEKGFTGGVAQSRPTTPVSSMISNNLLSGGTPVASRSNSHGNLSAINISKANSTLSFGRLPTDGPSEAMRTNDRAVNMSLNVPESPRPWDNNPEMKHFQRSPSPLNSHRTSPPSPIQPPPGAVTPRMGGHSPRVLALSRQQQLSHHSEAGILSTVTSEPPSPRRITPPYGRRISPTEPTQPDSMGFNFQVDDEYASPIDIPPRVRQSPPRSGTSSPLQISRPQVQEHPSSRYAPSGRSNGSDESASSNHAGPSRGYTASGGRSSSPDDHYHNGDIYNSYIDPSDTPSDRYRQSTSPSRQGGSYRGVTTPPNRYI